MAVVKLSRTVRRPIPLRWWQNGQRLAPVDCTGFSCEVVDTALPFVPAIEAVSPAQGQFRFAAPTPQQAELLRAGKTYGAHIVLKNALGEPVDEFRCTFEAV